MSEQSSEQRDDGPDGGPLTVPDEALPEDLRPSEDNPLAEPVGEDVPDDLLKETSGGGSSDTSSDDPDARHDGSDADA
jgi:hypothetical protein